MGTIVDWLPLILAVGGGLIAWGKLDGKMTAMQASITSMKEDIKEDIARLETKQDKYNHLQERMVRVEDSCSNAHHRITELHYGVHTPYDTKSKGE